MNYEEYRKIVEPIFLEFRNLSIEDALKETVKLVPFEVLEYVISGRYNGFLSMWVEACCIEHEKRIKEIQIAF